MHSKKKSRVLLFTAAVLIALGSYVLIAINCPASGFAFSSKARKLHQLKNRLSLPRAEDFDPKLTLDQLLTPGDDTLRWSTAHAARIRAYVVDVANARPEAANCFLPCRRDVHINLATAKGAAQNEQVVVELTPNLQEWAVRQGLDWSESQLRSTLPGHWCEFEGWLYFDVGHADQSENTSPNNPTNWRATAWEIHPITKITVLDR